MTTDQWTTDLSDEQKYADLERFRVDITFREAVDRFAGKEHVESVSRRVTDVSNQLAGVVSRHEHEARWQYEDQRYQRIDERNTKLDMRLDRLDAKMEDLRTHLPPKWLYPLLSIVIPVLLVAVQYLLHTQIPQAAH